MVEPILEQAYGYCFILALGFIFAVLMIVITKGLEKFNGEIQDSEHFSTASRNIKTGLIASAVVSSWTWPGTLLTSSAMTGKFGLYGGFVYGSAFTIQITFFAVLALEIKRKAPGAHTILEIIKVRFGKYSHWVAMFYGLGTNVIIAAMLLLGGCQAIAATTGMNVVAAALLLPVGVWGYTVTGGLKSTFISDWIHSVMIYAIISTMLYVTYCSSDRIGSIDKMYDLLTEAAVTHPSSGYEGSWLTWHNKSAMFSCWNIATGGFATVFTDPSYTTKAISSKPKSAMIGYFLGGICWMIIPLALSAASALSSVALMNEPDFPTYPDTLSITLTNEGMPMIYGMFMVLGKSGAAAAICMVWLAATSATSAELIGFSSVVTYDIYRTYFKPEATGKELIRVSHTCVSIFAILMGAVAVGFNYAGITVSWIITFIGIILGPGVFAFTLALFWKKMTPLSMTVGPPIATIVAIIGWCVSAKTFYGSVDKDTLGDDYSCAVGNFVGLFGSVILIVAITYIKPMEHDYDFSTMAQQFTPGDDATVEEAEEMKALSGEDSITLGRWSFWGTIISFVIFFILCIIFPIPMYCANYISSRAFFRGWIVVMMIWLMCAALFITFYPIWESRDMIYRFIQIMSGKKEAPHPELLSAQATNTSAEEVNIESEIKK
ncbi:hypothetical protein CANARDRAFT_8370 [[Candida] arabinofermentans NRRL YB-2248]|uniref:Urea active transporter n=1 Tax=[Candida] arabinofermentans NRRL YB-2248 TaxID=983967 RepID=A0A1E4SZ70_9ASCO|nr:hypothetical protein CANARDRAFT_8370 [[Candida] arabinofermentans NRRL YB-2248]